LVVGNNRQLSQKMSQRSRALHQHRADAAVPPHEDGSAGGEPVPITTTSPVGATLGDRVSAGLGSPGGSVIVVPGVTGVVGVEPGWLGPCRGEAAVAAEAAEVSGPAESQLVNRSTPSGGRAGAAAAHESEPVPELLLLPAAVLPPAGRLR
jgi:hypothetical protein